MEQKTETKAVTVAQPPKAPVNANSKGLLVGTNLEEQYRLASMMVKSGMLPRQYDTPEKFICGTQYAKEFGLPAMSSLRQISVINGTPSFYGDLPLGIVRASGKLKEIREELFDKDGKTISRKNGNMLSDPFGAHCYAKRADTGEETEKEYTMKDAERAKLDKKPGPWQEHRKRMLQLRARAWALKDLFSDVLSGAAIAEYDFDSLPESGEVPTGTGNKAQDLSNMLKQTKEVTAEVVETKTPEVVVETPKQEAPKEIEITHDPNFDANLELDFNGAPN